MTLEDTPGPPWPVVLECHYPAPSLVAVGHQCPQCNGRHEHAWVAWHDAPGVRPAIVGTRPARGIPVRCRVCGTRKCDLASCLLRRHHRGPHEHY